MKIYVTQGHELGVGLEVFLKSFLQLSISDQKQFILSAYPQSLRETLNSLNIRYQIKGNELIIGNSHLELLPVTGKSPYQTTNTLISCLEKIGEKDILLTLPTSKDQLENKGKNLSGYTEFLRSYYQTPDVVMFFYSPHVKIFLITDHVPLKDVSSQITSSIIESKVEQVIHGCLKHHLYDPTEILFSGINPHAGENGILGNEDAVIKQCLSHLKAKFPQINFQGPLSGDILSLSLEEKKNQILVYMHHDQGLSFFKSQMGLLGINISLGLPFLRVSVDHGTAFSLYGKNQANTSGCLYVIKEILKLGRCHGK